MLLGRPVWETGAGKTLGKPSNVEGSWFVESLRSASTGFLRMRTLGCRRCTSGRASEKDEEAGRLGDRLLEMRERAEGATEGAVEGATESLSNWSLMPSPAVLAVPGRPARRSDDDMDEARRRSGGPPPPRDDDSAPDIPQGDR